MKNGKLILQARQYWLLGFFFLHSSFSLAADSFMPSENIEQFVVQYLDLSTFGNSLNPRRQTAQRTFKDLGMIPTSIKSKEIEFDTEDWYYHISILRKADINNDGVEDIEVCFIDSSKIGSYSAKSALLLTRYSSSGYLIALKWGRNDCDSN